MKSSGFPRRLAVIAGLLSVSISAAIAADSAVSSADAAPPRLPYGVDDVLKLSRSQVSEDIIQNYIANSGTVYNLTPNEIVYLRNEGVSDRVINAMVDQRKRLTEVAAQKAPQPSPAPAIDYTAAYGAGYAAAPPVYTAPAPTYVQPASTLYVMSYPQAASSYYGAYYPYYSGGYYPYYNGGYYSRCYPYNRGYYNYWGSPVISFGHRYGGGWGHSHYGGWGRSHYGGHRR